MAVKTMNVLYGFTSDTIEKSITKEIMLRGFKVNSTKRTTKDLIKDFLKNHKEINVVVLKEYLDGGEKYSPIELTELVDDVMNVNVVIVLATSHRGKNEMKELYSAGILNAFFSDGKFGANPDKLAELACKGRTRREAREYYRINETVPDHINITYEEYREHYRYLLDNSYGLNVIERFVNISHMLYPGQMGGFIDAIPDKIRGILMQYQEFYDIANRIYRLGFAKQSYKRPKGLKKGISEEALNKKLASDLKGPREDERPVITAANVKVRSGIDMMNERDLAEIEDTADEVFEEPTAAGQVKRQKGIFRKTDARDKEDDDSIFAQSSDVEFEDGPVLGERVSADDAWEQFEDFDNGSTQEGDEPYEDEGEYGDTGGEPAEPYDETYDEQGYAEEEGYEDDAYEEEPQGKDSSDSSGEDVDYSSMSTEELMELLGK